MHQAIVILLKSIISSGALLGFYWIFLKNRNLHHYNRFYLLFTLALSIGLPFIHIYFVSAPRTSLEELLAMPLRFHSGSPDQIHNRLTWQTLSIVAYGVICGLMLLILAAKVIRLYRLKRRYSVVALRDIDIVQTDLKQAPFSFFNNLFWRSDISMQEGIGKKIFMHEMAHIRGFHSADKLFSQIALCVFWLNPFCWYLRKELDVVHEFIADAVALQPGDTTSFAKMLLRAYNGGNYLDPGHPFFNSSIKRRFSMLSSNTTPGYSWLRRFGVLPVSLSVTALLTISSVHAQTDPKLHPFSIIPDKVKALPLSDSLMELTIDYTAPNGNKETLHIKAKYSKNDSTKPDVIYDEESGLRREISRAKTVEILKQIIQDPPTDVTYLVDGKELLPAEIKKLDAKNIKTINIYNRQEAAKRYYAAKGSNGAIVLTTF